MDSLLIAALHERYDVARLFAWGGSHADGRIAWVDGNRRLQWVNFTKTDSGYRFYAGRELEEEASPLSTGLDEATLAPLADYLSDTELPVKVDTIDIGSCRGRVVLVWRAKQRSFGSDPDDKHEIMWAGLRFVVSRGATILANSTYEFEYLRPGQVLVADINTDSVKDYVFIGHYQRAALLAWTLVDSCAIEQLTCLEGDGPKKKRYESVGGTDIYFKRDGQGGYSIHAVERIPFKEKHVVEKVYQWRSSESAFVMSLAAERREGPRASK